MAANILASALGSISVIGMVALAAVASGCAKAQDGQEAAAPSSSPGPEVAATTPAPSKGQVLVLLSSANKMPLKNGKEYATGYFLNELMVPVKAMIEGGYTPVIANPEGNAPTMDHVSDSPSFFNNDAKALADIKALRDSLETYQHPRRIADVVREGLDGYVGVFVPGGHAPMGDLAKDPNVGEVLRHFHAQGKPTGLICHGPVALLAAAKDPAQLVEAIASGNAAEQKRLAEGWPYAGYRLTVFSRAEEQTAEEGGSQGFLKGFVRFYPDEALRAAGAKADVAEPWKSHVVRDRELITGQQPASDEEFTIEFMGALKAASAARSSNLQGGPR